MKRLGTVEGEGVEILSEGDARRYRKAACFESANATFGDETGPLAAGHVEVDDTEAEHLEQSAYTLETAQYRAALLFKPYGERLLDSFLMPYLDGEKTDTVENISRTFLAAYVKVTQFWQVEEPRFGEDDLFAYRIELSQLDGFGGASDARLWNELGTTVEDYVRELLSEPEETTVVADEISEGSRVRIGQVLREMEEHAAELAAERVIEQRKVLKEQRWQLVKERDRLLRNELPHWDREIDRHEIQILPAFERRIADCRERISQLHDDLRDATIKLAGHREPMGSMVPGRRNDKVYGPGGFAAETKVASIEASLRQANQLLQTDEENRRGASQSIDMVKRRRLEVLVRLEELAGLIAEKDAAIVALS